MNTPIEIITSKLKLLWIQLIRSIDHSYRIRTGLPARSRSMITPQLFVGGQYSGLGLDKLHSREFTAIVNMRLPSFEEMAKNKGLRYLHLPTVDLHAPTIAHLQQGVKFIQEEIDRGGRVYVHCRGGEGRGPSMAIAYLMSTGLTFDDAFAQVKKVRSFIRPTKVQIERLKEFEKLYTAS